MSDHFLDSNLFDGYLMIVWLRDDIALTASSCEDMTTNPRLREELSTVAKMTQCDTVPYCVKMDANSFLSVIIEH